MYSQMRGSDGSISVDRIVRDDDDAIIPADPLNYDWQAYQAWLKAGNHAAEPAPRATPAAA